MSYVPAPHPLYHTPGTCCCIFGGHAPHVPSPQWCSLPDELYHRIAEQRPARLTARHYLLRELRRATKLVQLALHNHLGQQFHYYAGGFLVGAAGTFFAGFQCPGVRLRRVREFALKPFWNIIVEGCSLETFRDLTAGPLRALNLSNRIAEQNPPTWGRLIEVKRRKQ